MITMYRTNEENKLEKVTTFERGTWINLVNPSNEEILEVCQGVNITDEFIRSALDYEEQARIDVEDDATLFVIDIPTVEKTHDGEMHVTMPLGIIVVRDDFFITVCLHKSSIINDFEKGLVKSVFTYKKTRFLLQIMFKNAKLFLFNLKQINKQVEITEQALQKSMKNKELLQLLNLEKSLVYFSTSLKSNEIVMEKTLRGRIIKLYEEDEDILEDAIVENKQAIEMSKIYSDILAGTMDAYASIISNNLNIVMKFLASFTILLSLPTVISSFFGMNVPFPFQESKYGYLFIFVISIGVVAVFSWWLKKKDMF